MKKISIVICLLVFVLATAAFAGNARMPAIKAGAARLTDLQRTDSWAGTWYWYVGNTYNAPNLTGVTALGVLEAFRDTKDPACLETAELAANFLFTHLGAGATGTKYHMRWTAPDVIFVYHLGKITANEAYIQRAKSEWANIKATYPSAASLDERFRATNRASIWDMAFFMEAAYLCGDMVWASAAAAIIADIGDAFYYDMNTSWYALNVAAAIRSLIGCGFAMEYQAEILDLYNILAGISDGDNGVDGYVQETAYAVLAFNSIGGPARPYANELGRWLATQIVAGGWLLDGDEYPEINGEAVRALASTIGTNFTLDGFEPGQKPFSNWRKAISGKGVPFSED